MAGKWKLNPHKGNEKKRKDQTDSLDREIIDSDKDSEEDMTGQYKL